MNVKDRKVKIVVDGQPPLYGIINKVIHPVGPAWPALFEINLGTELKLYYEYGEGYELFFQ